jgi:uncharacterized protein (DUF2141 family)
MSPVEAELESHYMQATHPTGRAMALAAALAFSGSAHAFDLTIEVLNPKLLQGSINAALYADAAGWMKEAQALAAQRVPVAEKTVLVFRQLGAGSYAVSLFHDENGNGKLDSNIVGLPTERFGFSRDARAVMGPPGFTDAAITLAADTTISITLK